MEINSFAKMNYERSKKNDKNNSFNWEFYAIALAGEAGELLNVIKKVKRGDFQIDKEKVAEETADVITYAFLLLSELGLDTEEVIMKKFEKVNKRISQGGFHVR